MSIYASLPGISPDEPCGAPWHYRGSHVLPHEDDPRGGTVDLALIPSHITRDGRDDQPEDGAPWPWLRLSLNHCGDDSAVVINLAQARHLAAQLTAWADTTGGPAVTDPTPETLTTRLRLAHQTRRAKEHQLDDIRRALCDVGAIHDNDPYSHADLADVIRQNWGGESADARALHHGSGAPADYGAGSDAARSSRV